MVELFHQSGGEIHHADFKSKTAIDHTGSVTPLIDETVPLLVMNDKQNDQEISIYAAPDIIEHLDGVSFNQMEQSELLTWLFKLQLAHSHEHQKLASADSEFKKKTAILLRVEIKDNANSRGWIIWSGIGVVLAGAGLLVVLRWLVPMPRLLKALCRQDS